MYHELIKHIHQIKRQIRNSTNFIDKLKEIIIEVGIIVFAVTLSIWLHEKSVHKEQQNEVSEFLVDIEEDLQKDKQKFIETKNEVHNSNHYLTNIVKTRKESADSIMGMEISFITRKTRQGNFESFKTSGKISYIRNKEIKHALLDYYQNTIAQVEDAEIVYNNLVDKIVDASAVTTDMKALLNQKYTLQLINYLTQSGNANIEAYNDAIKSCDSLILLIKPKLCNTKP